MDLGIHIGLLELTFAFPFSLLSTVPVWIVENLRACNDYDIGSKLV